MGPFFVAPVSAQNVVPGQVMVKFGNGGRQGSALSTRLSTARQVNQRVTKGAVAAVSLKDFPQVGWQLVLPKNRLRNCIAMPRIQSYRHAPGLWR